MTGRPLDGIEPEAEGAFDPAEPDAAEPSLAPHPAADIPYTKCE
ncbi:hypothetical protein C8J29_10419 [Cereibacter johrii]|uniref:Uncharacterized protein n=1 Tax=Cereibacter johrii TaxID=445629 RepID=A0ABX5J572_9RHOB|nr:hypothetical protein C8J29_10419 [Cereibacter johrii]